MFLVWVPAAVDLSVKFAAGVSRVRSGLQIALAILAENALVAAQALIILMGYQILKTLLPECKYLPWRMEGPAEAFWRHRVTTGSNCRYLQFLPYLPCQ